MNVSCAIESTAYRTEPYLSTVGRKIKSLAMLPICLSLMNCSSFPEAWKDYKQIFIEEGRVIDTGNKRISHSEGQGYGMLLSVYFNDEHAFEEMWAWTKQNLQVRKDHLFSWLWAKGPNGSFEVMDTNNATDGDLLLSLIHISEPTRPY